MQFLNHDFYSNFKGSVGAGDVEFSLDLWVNEVSDLVVTQTDKVIDLLDKVGISAKRSLSHEAIVDKILDNIGKNDKLNRGIAFLIGENNDLIQKDANWKDSIDKIALAYEPIMKNLSENGSLRASVKTDLMQHIKSKAEGSKTNERVVYKEDTPDQARRKHRNLMWGVLAGFAVIGLTTWAVCYYKKKNALPLTMAPLPGTVPPPPPTAPLPAAPAPAAVAPVAPAVVPPPPPASVQTVNVAPAPVVPQAPVAHV